MLPPPQQFIIPIMHYASILHSVVKRLFNSYLFSSTVAFSILEFYSRLSALVTLFFWVCRQRKADIKRRCLLKMYNLWPVLSKRKLFTTMNPYLQWLHNEFLLLMMMDDCRYTGLLIFIFRIAVQLLFSMVIKSVLYDYWNRRYSSLLSMQNFTWLKASSKPVVG